MKLTLKQLVLAHNTIKELNTTKGLKGSVAYKIAKNYKLIEDEMEPYLKTEQAVVQKYALKDDNGEYRVSNNQYLFSTQDIETVQNELNEIQTEEVEIDIKTISLDDLEDVGLSGEQLINIEFMLGE